MVQKQAASCSMSPGTCEGSLGVRPAGLTCLHLFLPLCLRQVGQACLSRTSRERTFATRYAICEPLLQR